MTGPCPLRYCTELRPHVHPDDNPIELNLTPATVPVSEVFPAWQGEGPAAGRACTFLRTGLCNLGCSWCDTPFTWDKSRYDVDTECPPRGSGWIINEVRKHPARLLILSGGEPLMHRTNDALLNALSELTDGRFSDDPVTNHPAMTVHVETNGTLTPLRELAAMVETFIVSPKVAQTDDPLSKRIKPQVIQLYADMARERPGSACFKFVARHTGDVDAIKAIARDFHLPPESVWVMPEGIHTPDLLDTHRAIAPLIEGTGFNTTTRLHVLLYGTQRGR